MSAPKFSNDPRSAMISQPQTDACPPSFLLDQFSRGRVDSLTLDRIATHVEACPRCLASVAASKVTLVEDSEDLLQWVEELAEVDIAARSLAALDSEMPPSIGKYVLRGLIASGGMGVVYAAWHPGLQCEVVVKTIKPSRQLRRSDRMQMIAEQRALGRIRHPSIVSVLDADVVDELPFIVMEKIDGSTLSELVQLRGRLPHDEVCRIAISISEALAAIHLAGLVHRDVKPANVMIDRNQNVKLLDLGLAHEVRSNPAGGGNSEPAARVGTPGFAAPEQAAGSPVDHRCDLFGLGTTMLYCLCGKRFLTRYPSCQDAIDSLVDGPLGLRDLLSELTKIDPRQRPDSAAEVALRLSRPESNPKRFLDRRSARSIMGASIMAVTIPIALIAGLWILAVGNGPTKHARPELVTSTSADHIRAKTSLLFLANPTRLGGILPKNDAPHLETALPRPGVIHAAFSSDRRQLACFGMGGALRIYDATKRPVRLTQVVDCFPHTDVDRPQILWLEHGNAVAVTSAGYDPVLIWDVQQRHLRARLPSTDEVIAADVDPSGDNFALARRNGEIAVHNAEGLVRWTQRIDDVGSIRQVRWTDDGDSVVAATRDRGLLRITAGSVAPAGQPLPDSVTALQRTSDGDRWYVGTDEGDVLVLDTQFKVVDRYRIDAAPIQDLVVIDDGKWLFAATQRQLWRIPTDRHLSTKPVIHRPSKPIRSISAAGRGVLVASDDLNLVYPDASTPAESLVPSGRSIRAIDFSPGEGDLAVAASQGTLLLVSPDGRGLTSIESGLDAVEELRWSPNGSALAISDGWGGSSIEVWAKVDGRFELLTSIDAANAVATLDWLDDDVLLSAGESGMLNAWDINSGRRVWEQDCGSFVRRVRVSPDRGTIAVGLYQGGLRKLNVADGQLSSPIESLTAVGVHWIDWADANRMAVASNDRKVTVLDIRTNAIIASHHSPWSRISGIDFYPDGNRIGISPLGIFRLTDQRRLLQIDQQWFSRQRAGTPDSDLHAAAAIAGRVHVYRGDRFAYTVLVASADSTIVIDPNGQVISSIGSPIDLLR